MSQRMAATRRSYPAPGETDLRTLAACDGPVLSLFVPVTAAVPDATQNRVRHGRVVASTLERWRELGADPDEVARAEVELHEFARDPSSPDATVASRAAFWSAEAGCGVFGLPFPVPEQGHVATGAHLRPIARAAGRPGRFRVLVLSANHVALHEGNETALVRVESGEVPASLEAALGSQVGDPSLQFHSGASGGERPVYHGQGGAPRERRVDLERFHRRVARALEAEVGADVVPLVLAADARHRPGLLHPLKRDVGLIEAQVEGDASHLSASELHAATWPLIADSVAGAAHEALDQAREDRRRKTTSHISEIVSNAVMGRVRRLWVPESGAIPGRIDTARGRAAPAWGDDDLIDGLMIATIRRGGSVHVLVGETFPSHDGEENLVAELR